MTIDEFAANPLALLLPRNNGAIISEEATCVCFQVRWEALQALCSAPPSDVLSCENGSSLHKHLGAALADPDLSVSPDPLASEEAH